jgi:hypothetical protein
MSTASRHPACLGYPGNGSARLPSIFFLATREKCTFSTATVEARIALPSADYSCNLFLISNIKIFYLDGFSLANQLQ